MPIAGAAINALSIAEKRNKAGNSHKVGCHPYSLKIICETITTQRRCVWYCSRVGYLRGTWEPGNLGTWFPRNPWTHRKSLKIVPNRPNLFFSLSNIPLLKAKCQKTSCGFPRYENYIPPCTVHTLEDFWDSLAEFTFDYLVVFVGKGFSISLMFAVNPLPL